MLGQLSAPEHLPEEVLSRQAQLLLPTLTCLPRALGTQLIPHDLGIFFFLSTIIRPEPGRSTTGLLPENKHHRSLKVLIPSSLTGQAVKVHLLHSFRIRGMIGY